MTDETLVTTKKMDIPAFRAGIFSFGPTILSPVEHYLDEGLSFVSLQDACEQEKNLSNGFFPWIATGGIGLYSLKKGPAGILTRLDILFRDATSNEMRHDFGNFGEQVMGPEIGTGEDRKYKGNPIFNAWGTEYFYIGPPRIIKGRFATRAFQGPLPEADGLERFMKQVDEIGLLGGPKSDGSEVVPQGYRLFHADQGIIYHTGFGKIEEYDPDKMREVWGEVGLGRDHVNFYPNGSREKAVDFTALLKDLPEDFYAD